MKLSTIGYEGASLPDFLATLRLHEVDRVIDIRELPQSRRAGFSKNVLSAALQDVGINYEHVKALGDPKAGRLAARAGDMNLFKSIFCDHLDGDGPQKALVQVADTAISEHCVLLCYERDPKHCHRKLVVDELVRLHSFSINHIGVQPTTGTQRRENARAEGYAGAL